VNPKLLPAADPPKFDSDMFFAMLLFYRIIYLTLLGARATLDHFPQEISTNLFSNT